MRHVITTGEYPLDQFRGLDGPAPAAPASPSTPANAASAAVAAAAMPSEPMNMYTALNSGMAIALETNEKTVLFGEDVGFGGVFRCSEGLRDRFGADRVANAPVSEQAIAAFAIGLSQAGWDAIAEMQAGRVLFSPRLPSG